LCSSLLVAHAQVEDDGEPGPTSDLTAARQARDALIAASDFQAALAPAESSVELSANTSEANYYSDLMHLARVQAELGEYEDAEANYLGAIAYLEEREGQNSTQLIEPYQGLGRNYINSRRFPEAVTVLEHARYISQRDSGLFNLEQTELIDDITMAHLGQGDTLAAQELQLARLDNAVRRYGADDPRLVPFHQHLGEYYDNSRLRVSAREQFERALAIQQSQTDGNVSELLGSLRKLAQLELMLGDGDEARLRLEAALRENPDLSAIDRGLSLALLGDCALVAEDTTTAARYYADAYAALELANAIQAREYFSQPAMIDFIPPLNAVDLGRRSDPYGWASILLRFDVSAEGRVADVETVRMEPGGDADEDYSRRIRETHFRPRLDGGVPVATSDVEFTHFFRYYVRRRRR
jgi:lipoprotein NlpI